MRVNKLNQIVLSFKTPSFAPTSPPLGFNLPPETHLGEGWGKFIPPLSGLVSLCCTHIVWRHAFVCNLRKLQLRAQLPHGIFPVPFRVHVTRWCGWKWKTVRLSKAWNSRWLIILQVPIPYSLFTLVSRRRGPCKVKIPCRHVLLHGRLQERV